MEVKEVPKKKRLSLSQKMDTYTVFQARIGLNIKDCRERKQMTQEELATRSQLSINVISRLERGVTNPRLSTIYKIALILDANVSDLLNFDL
ncbi:helix-turn-helix transcriptional regulator [Vibrio cholerae]|nr:helix-turn-helix transcriptional regulator [Vibrio cholerae]EKF9843117.1 helix-turn-helix transcriptional regulator [Vibrio cholerae]